MNRTDKELEDSLNQIVVDLLKEIKDNVDKDNLYLSILNNSKVD